MMGFKPSVLVDEIRGTVTVNKLESPQEPPKTFTFDTVFGPDSKQLDVYNLTARPIIESVLEGYNGETSAICSNELLFSTIAVEVNLHVIVDFRHHFCIWTNWHR